MNNLLHKAYYWFQELEIRVERNNSDTLLVNKKDINTFGFGSTELISDYIIRELRKSMGTNKFYWEGSDDNWLCLKTF